MNKKFTFVNLSINCGYNSGMNHGIAFLVPVAKKYKYEISCLNIREEITSDQFVNKIKDISPSIVAFSCTSHQLKFLKKYSEALDKFPEILQIAGGVGATLDPNWVLFNTCVKGACIGEGEIPLDGLLRNLDNKENIYNCEGFYWHVDGAIKKNSIPQFITDWSKRDLPDHAIFGNTVVGANNNLSVMLSRGCPYNCYYCCNVTLSNVYPASQGYFRVYPVEYSIRLIEKMIKQCPATKFIHFEDDLLIANKTWFYDFTEEYRRKIRLPYRMCVRVECVTPEIVERLKNSGCKIVFIGLESGDETLRSNFLNRKYSNDLFIEKCKLIKKARLKLFTFNIVGFPFETKKEMENTFKLNRIVSPDSGVCTFFYPYKATELYRICKDNNLLRSDFEMLDITNYNTRPAIKMSAKQEKECILFQRKILNYLLRQSELSQLRDLPFGIKKYFVFMRHWVKSILRYAPALDKLARLRLSSIKIKALETTIIKNP